MKIEITKISKKLKNLREQKELTQEELAKTLGVTRQSIISLEQGRCLPSLPLAISFSEVFELPFERIFGDEIEEIHSRVGQILAQDLTALPMIDEMDTLHDAIDRVFEESHQPNRIIEPLINIYESNARIIIVADFFGVKEENVSIEAGNDSIAISGFRLGEDEKTIGESYLREINFGKFSRTIPLPSTINKDKTTAELKNGLLKIIMPKLAKNKLKITKISVKRG